MRQAAIVGLWAGAQLVADDDAVGDERIGELRARDEAVVEEHRREHADERHLVRLADRVARRARLALAHEPRRLPPGRRAPRRASRAGVEELADVAGRVGPDERARRSARGTGASSGRRSRRAADARPAFRSRYFSFSPRSRSGSGRCGRELGDAVVEEGEAAFDRVAHQHPVALRVQEVALEEGGDLEVLRPAERRHLAEPGRAGAPPGVRPGRRAPAAWARTSPSSSAEQPRGVREAEAMAVERVVGLGQALAVEGDQKGARALQVLADERVQTGEEQRAQARTRARAPRSGAPCSRGRGRSPPKSSSAPSPVVTTFSPASRTAPREAQQRDGRGAQRRLLRQLDRAREELGDVARPDRDAREARARASPARRSW